MSTRIIQLPRPVSRTQVQDPEKVSKPRKPVEPSALTAEYLRSILDYDQETGIFTWKVSTSRRVKTGDVAGSQNGDGYLRIRLHNRLFLAHRLAWLYHFGEWPEDQIDHINRNRSDNRIYNLREVTNKQNQQNAGKRSDNKSGHPGVSWYKPYSKWRAQIMHNQKQIHLGYFSILEEAIAARKAAEKLYWADTQIAEPAPV